MIEFRKASCVLVASNFNLSIFKQLWLIKNGILREEETADGEETYFTPVACNVKNDAFDFLVVPERAQISFFNDSGQEAGIIKRVIGGVVRSLPHTPCAGIGLNFEFSISSGEKAFFEKSKTVCMSDNNPLLSVFSESDARFGFYASMDVEGARMRIEAKPVKGHDGVEHTAVHMNFHKDLTVDEEPKVEDVDGFIDSYSKFYDLSMSMVKKLDSSIAGEG